MNKEQVDELYHLLRVVSNQAIDPVSAETGLTGHEIVDVIAGMTRHLLAGGDYPALIKFCMYYGRRFLLTPTGDAIDGTSWQFHRVVELGAGTGWLGRGIAARFDYIPCLFVDKRQWALIDLIADLETEVGRQSVLATLKDNDLLVMSDFLHCVEDPKEILTYFSKWNIAILEYMPTNESWASSYEKQLARYGGNPIQPSAMTNMLSSLGRKVDVIDIDPYTLILIDKET